MKNAFALAVVASLLSAFAVTVPQSSIDKYYFSRPNCTNVTGTVIGQPPAYSTLRREDIAWLREAAAERAALQSRTWNGLSSSRVYTPVLGSFPLSQTNRFYRYVTAKEWINNELQTNIVVGFNYVTNMGSGIDKVRSASIDIASSLSFGSGFSGYLSPNDADWLQSSQAIGGETFSFYLPGHTNIITNVTTSYPSYYWGDNGYTDNTTQCVEVITMRMTNGTVSAWTNKWTVPLPLVETRATTNISWGYSYDLLFSGKQIVTYDAPKPEPFSGIPRYSTVTNWYGYLRGMSRLAEVVSATNNVKCYTADWYGDEWEYGGPREYDGHPETMYVSGGYAGVGGGWGYGQWPASGGHTMYFQSGFKWPLVTTGGVNRIRSATLYVVIDGSSDDWEHRETGYFAKNLGSATQAGTPSPYGYVIFSASVNHMALFREAASALGFSYFPSMDGKDYCDDFSLSMNYYLVYDLAPLASLPGWNNQGEPSP